MREVETTVQMEPRRLPPLGVEGSGIGDAGLQQLGWIIDVRQDD